MRLCLLFVVLTSCGCASVSARKVDADMRSAAMYAIEQDMATPLPIDERDENGNKIP